MISLKTIAYIKSDFPSKFGIPRQSNLVNDTEAQIILTPEYRNPDALRGLEEFSHIWIIWGFSKAERPDWSPTVRPPKLGGNKRMGVFATRSPFRPNPIALSSVKITKIDLYTEDGPIIHVEGADLMDGTPIYDIKPYLAFTDSHPDASGGFTAHLEAEMLNVIIPAECRLKLSSNKEADTLRALLEQDPRPSYQSDPTRIYGMEFADYEVKFIVEERIATVLDIIKVK